MILLVLLFVTSFSVPAHAVSFQDWIKKSNEAHKTRRVTSRQTTVAAVRGVEELNDVDPEARNPEGVEKMEKRAIPKEKLDKFIEQGMLRRK